MKQVLFVIVVLFTSSLCEARVDLHEFKNPQQEARYKRLIAELRCLVCQNQNLADSNAELAEDLRQKTYEMIMRGEPDDKIIEYMVARYGDFVLYRPPLKATTLVLWAGPFLILFLGIVIAIVYTRRQKQRRVVLSTQEHERARAMLKDTQ